LHLDLALTFAVSFFQEVIIPQVFRHFQFTGSELFLSLLASVVTRLYGSLSCMSQMCVAKVVRTQCNTPVFLSFLGMSMRSNSLADERLSIRCRKGSVTVQLTAYLRCYLAAMYLTLPPF